MAAAAPAATPFVATLTCPAPEPIRERSVAVTVTVPAAPTRPRVTAPAESFVPPMPASTVCETSLNTSDVPTPAFPANAPPTAAVPISAALVAVTETADPAASVVTSAPSIRARAVASMVLRVTAAPIAAFADSPAAAEIVPAPE